MLLYQRLKRIDEKIMIGIIKKIEKWSQNDP